MRHTVLISDMHLCDAVPALTTLFQQKLTEWAGNIDALYLLGDIFDAWIGDDGADTSAQLAIASMNAFSQKTPIYVMHGNRDFLLGEQFLQKSGTQLLPDPFLADFYGKPYLLSHGDAMCTEDTAYLAFRAQSRNPLWQQAVLSKPLAERQMLAHQLRQISQNKQGEAEQYAISDVTEAGLINLQKQFSGSLNTPPDIIHGHTHRPFIHQHQYQQKPYIRYVLPDWHGHCGGCLKIYADHTVQQEDFSC